MKNLKVSYKLTLGFERAFEGQIKVAQLVFERGSAPPFGALFVFGEAVHLPASTSLPPSTR